MRAFRLFAAISSASPQKLIRPFSVMASGEAVRAAPAPAPAPAPHSPQTNAKMASPTRLPQKRPNSGNNRPFKTKKSKREKNMTEGSSENVLQRDIQALLKSRASQSEINPNEEAQDKLESLPEEGTETDVEILDISSTGDGLGMKQGSNQVYVVPFTVPGDTARVKVFRHQRQTNQTLADFISISKPSSLRDDSRIKCKYFASCGGCQFQMLDYSEQLKLKKRVLDKAYSNMSNLPADLIPTIQDTIGSPLQYGYRTKLTPHFDGPPGFRKGKNKVAFEKCPDVGFMLKGRRKTMDIEDCPIGTDVVRLGMARERGRMQKEFQNYHRGATILLREDTQRQPKEDSASEAEVQSDTFTIKTEKDGQIETKRCETNSTATTTEYVGPYIFTNPAGSFFQNNNSILEPFTEYIRSHILPPSGSVKYLIDAYSGSGLFTITLSSTFQHSTGIDVAADSIACARRNAALNGLSDDRCVFIAADARELFRNVKYEADETVVVLDPPRKGCDADFLGQLRRFGPRRVLYVSCNVHTQARDVGILVRGEGEGARYTIESLRGFDFFPQTGHVEGVAILNRVDEDA